MFFWRKFEDKLAAVYIQQAGFFTFKWSSRFGWRTSCDGSFKDKMITATETMYSPLVGVDHVVSWQVHGKATGTSQGLGGSMHIFSKNMDFMVVMELLVVKSVGAGMAFGDKYNETGVVTLCFFGDGAARQGSLHETFNMAMNWKLPVVFVCENNGYAMGTSVEQTIPIFGNWD